MAIRRVSLTCLLTALMLIGSCSLAHRATAAAVPHAAQARAAQAATLARLRSFAATELSIYDGRSRVPGYEYAHRTFANTKLTGQSWFLFDIPATTAATLGVLERDRALRRLAVSTYSRALSRQLADGAFSPTDSEADVDSVGTTFFGAAFGVTDLELRPQLAPGTRRRWRSAMARLAGYLISSGDASWYINGNVNLRETEIMWLAYAITGQARFRTAYRAELGFTLHPSQVRWPGYGLHLVHGPHGEAGYLAESNTGSRPGYDPNYTNAQLDTATELYVLTHDPRYLRLMTLFYNQLTPRVSSDWILDAIGGSRDSFAEPMMSPAISVLAASGRFPGLAAAPASQLREIEQTYTQSASYPNINFYKGFESDLTMPLLNQQHPQGMAPPSTIARGDWNGSRASQRRTYATRFQLGSGASSIGSPPRSGWM